MNDLPLKNLVVLDFSQFLAGPGASLRLADLGARVIKIERPEVGDLARQLYISNLEFDGDSTLFHTVNRNKESFAANLKDPQDLAKVRLLIAKADVMIQNFRPGVIDRLGLGYDVVRQLNPRIVYATVSGYGSEGPWKDKPGQDLLAQAVSGLTWLSGNADDPPTPFGLSVADMITGANLAQGILACLVRRGVTNEGGLVEVSLLESILDLQFELLTTHLSDGGQPPERSAKNNANAYLAAPYGIYATQDGYLALAMGNVPQLGALLDIPKLASYKDIKSWFDKRDEIKELISSRLCQKATSLWLGILEPKDVWCAEVMTWRELLEHEGFRSLQMLQEVNRCGGHRWRTTRCPIQIDGQILTSSIAAPRVGEHTQQLCTEMELTANSISALS